MVKQIGSIIPVQIPELDYTQAEKNQVIEGLPKNRWLLGDKNCKYTVLLEGLLPNSDYVYEVMLNGEIFKSDFETPPTVF